MKKVILISSLVAGIIIGCGSSSSSSSNELVKGQFIDSPVEGLKYVSKDVNGTTDKNGYYQCKSTENVTFYAGGIKIGEAICSNLTTPLTLADNNVTIAENIAYFIQNIDKDGNISNGIQILDNIPSMNIDFSNKSDIDYVLHNLGITPKITPNEAYNNFKNYLAQMNQDNVSGLTPQEKEALEYMYQEEKLAKDVYYVLGKMYPDLRVFNNIYEAEITHERSVANVLQHYNIPLPIRSDEVGKFKNPEIQNLYNELIAKGEKSKVDALEVGIMVEVTDVEDLDRYLEEATSPDVIALFKFLRAGSYDHYNAFNRNLIALTGKSACELMDSKWCKDYPSQQGIETDYKDYYWFDGEVGGYRGK